MFIIVKLKYILILIHINNNDIFLLQTRTNEQLMAYFATSKNVFMQRVKIV